METNGMIYLIEIEVERDGKLTDHNVYVKARDLEEAVERAAGRLAMNSAVAVKITGVRDATNERY